jgi:predicted ArsR family transcriptional regulator
VSGAAPEDAADVLAQRTRAQLFARLVDLGRPAQTDELAKALGLHASGVRLHLERLRRAGLVTRERVPQPTGRPRDAWTVAPDAPPGSEPPGAYANLASWLALSITPSPARLRELERAGRQVGAELGPERGSGGSEEAMGRALTALGFAPQHQRDPVGQTIFTLGSCPYRQAVRANQSVVCALHRGITRGLLDRIAPGTQLTRFEPRDPDLAGCVVQIAGLKSEPVLRR